MNIPAPKTVAGYLAIIAIGFVGYKAYRLGSSLVASGSTVAQGATAALKQIVTEDLNPVSDKNIVYTGANVLGAAATGDKDFNLGAKVYTFLHGDPTANVTASSPSNVKKQAEQIIKNQEEFRKQEIKSQNANQAATDKIETAMDTKRSFFRIGELEAANTPPTTDFDTFLQTIAGQRGS